MSMSPDFAQASIKNHSTAISMSRDFAQESLRALLKFMHSECRHLHCHACTVGETHHHLPWSLDTNFHIASGTHLAPLGPSSLHIPIASPNFAYSHQNIYWGLSFLCSVLALAQQMESLLCELLAQLLVAVASLEEQSMVSLAVMLK